MSITQKIQPFAHDLSRLKENGNSHLESALTTTNFEKCSRGMVFLRVNRWPLLQIKINCKIPRVAFKMYQN